jgi:adenosylcobinamide-GDP ribazoletransferase
MTGGIHLDGFSDTCDSFYGSRTHEEILRIMRDPRTGVIGVIGVVCLLLLKFTLIVSIPQSFLWKSLILMATFSRWSQSLACFFSNYARDEGKAKLFIEYARKEDIVIGSFFTLVLFLLTISLIKTIFVFFLSFLCVFLWIHFVKRKIGGMTGDTIGATNEIAEILVLFFILISIIYF